MITETRQDGRVRCRLPLVLRWPALPCRAVRPIGTQSRFPQLDPPAWIDSGPADQPFDFAGRMQRLAADIARRCPALAHIDADRLLIGVIQARSGRDNGLQARVTPLRCRDGQLTRVRRGTVYQVQRYFVAGREVLYLVAFCLPRYLDRPFDDKLVTLFHELYHISPDFNGDLRRHHGRCAIHSKSKKQYDRVMAQLAREYLAGRPDESLHAFLRLDFAQLMRRHGAVRGIFVPRPKLVPVGHA